MRHSIITCIGITMSCLTGSALAQVLTGDDIVLTDISPSIAYDDTDTPGNNWVVRGDDSQYSVYSVDAEALNPFVLFVSAINVSTALGWDSSATGDFSMALGNGASATAESAHAVGTGATAGGFQSITLGYSAEATGTASASLGYNAGSTGSYSIALGYGATSVGTSSATLGYAAAAAGNFSNSLGYGASANGNRSTAVGYGAIAESSSSTAIGAYAIAQQANAIVLGSIPGVNSALDYADVGIGTTAPAQAVDVERSAAAARFQLTSFTNTGTEAPQYIQRRARGTTAAPTAVLNNDNLGLFSFRGYNGSVLGGSRATITAQAAGNFTVSSTPTWLIFATTPVGSTTPQQVLVITPDGKVQVNGQNLNVPDYVFADNYPLMPLEELQAFIDINGHLPGIASADEVNTMGHDLAGSDMAHLRKIEELTLYTLQQQKRIDRLERQLTQALARLP